MCTLKKIMHCLIINVDWMTIISSGTRERIVWIFTPDNAGFIGNERTETLAEAAVFDNYLTLDAPLSFRYAYIHTYILTYKLTDRQTDRHTQADKIISLSKQSFR